MLCWVEFLFIIIYFDINNIFIFADSLFHRNNTMYKSNFKVLYHFQNNNISILEIKRNGILSDDKSKIYHWLMYDKVNDLLQPFHFLSMNQTNDEETRLFNGFSLKFSTNKALFTDEKSGTKTSLEIISTKQKLNQTLEEAIDNYFLLLSFKDSSGK